MANLKVIVGCSVSFFGLLWLFFWKKSPKQKPPSDSKENHAEDTHRKLPSVGSKNNLPDVVHQSTESESPGIQQEAVLEKVLSNKEVVQTESCILGDSSEAQDADQDQECVEEPIIQEEVLTSSSCAVTQSGNKTLDTLEYDMNCNGDSTRFSTSEYNSTQIAGSDDNLHRNSAMNEAFMTSDIGDGIMNKTCEKPTDSTHDVSLSTSTFAEPLLESTKLDITACENEQSMKIECSVPSLIENNITYNNKHMNGKQVHDNENDKNDSFKNCRILESDSIVNQVNSNHDQMTSSWSSEVESCDNVDKQTDIELCGGDNSNSVHTADSVGPTPSKTDSSAHGSDSNTSNCDSVSSNCSSRASSIVETPNKSGSSKKETYEFNFPTQFCGRLIGKHGKNIQLLKERSGANISLSNHPYTPDFQLCLIEGTQRHIDEALKVIGRKFPDVDLTAIGAEVENEPEPSTNGKPMLMPDIMQLNLPEGVSIDVVVSSIVDAGHVFVQQHTHPSFPSLERLNQFMIACYTQDSIVPQLPRPLEVGVVCSAPMLNGWYRAQITAVYDDTDECDIKYVDYGGFSRVPGCTLRQIRSDFMTLPFQAVECYMANITPIQDEEYFSSEAAATLEELTQGKLLQAQIVGRNEDGTPYIHIYQIAGEKVVFVNRELVNRGVTRWIELMS
ncbi:KH domain-containing protein akap-1-like isoform X2 [Mizuhopecten yessoensis]|uniref:KH domain-containing protein akap-1-like isoform X2 n=1 Tax=Mizuhopecten yessoensis TaxID=6573 RepID=UPI000B45BA5B|nr:KH domain-containing protein akap-1-like isoform X2 [Mizuhopecten yessoensis]